MIILIYDGKNLKGIITMNVQKINFATNIKTQQPPKLKINNPVAQTLKKSASSHKNKGLKNAALLKIAALFLAVIASFSACSSKNNGTNSEAKAKKPDEILDCYDMEPEYYSGIENPVNP